ncbi:TPA: hypothetical protein U2D27_000936 [Streptococcus suis]|nr:hypothetical protein [Streptococcus suis]HEM6362937.1 hypothetical protein [Streptococcus suis]HEM6402877.1 hypothetical protein [Streptococcus suis]
MDVLNSLKRFLNLKNNLIPSIRDNIGTLQAKLAMEEAGLNLIKDEKVFLEDFKREIRTRGFTIFNLVSLTSILMFLGITLVLALGTVVITILGVIIETFIRTFVLFQDYDFEDSFVYIPIKAFEDFIYNPPTIPLSVIIGLLVIWAIYSIFQIPRNRAYYENTVIPENRKKNALVPSKRRKQQVIVDNARNALQTANNQLFSYQDELQNIMRGILLPEEHWSNDEALNFLIQKLEYGQAKTINGALSLWDRELQTRRVEQAARDLIRETRESEARLARQRQEQFIQATKAQQARDEVQEKIAEEMKRKNDHDAIRDNIAKRNGWL